MNSDPYDSAAWRTFGMLDADETASFDEAMRDDPALRKYSLEMDRLSAAIAASATTPAVPAPGQLEAIQIRLKLSKPQRSGRWFAITGWAAAIVMAVILISDRRSSKQQAEPRPSSLSRAPSGTTPNPADTSPTEVVAKRLAREIEMLRENLEKFQHRDRALFTALPGRALPIVIAMTPPGTPVEDHPITTLLADGLRATTALPDEIPAQEETIDQGGPPAAPSAMPIYDAARDFGTLVVSNLPDAGEGASYNLWVTTETGTQPVYVGSLPESSANSAASFDFSLGSTMILPSEFILTRDPLNAPASPTENNIVLQGPSAPPQ